MRFLVPVILPLALVACAPQVPDSAAGVGFQSYPDYLKDSARREAELRGQGGGGARTVRPPQDQASDSVMTDAERASILGATGSGSAPAEPSAPSPNDARISDEQSFDAVASRETIASDRDRIEENRAQYKVIQPSELPSRAGSTGPNIVEFALATNNSRGQPLYSRSGIFAESRFNRNCAKYASNDLAQEDFLSSGGPERDRKGLDPDGDGFACYWDPAPFRNARRRSGN